jgi:hypothetical protein
MRLKEAFSTFALGAAVVVVAHMSFAEAAAQCVEEEAVDACVNSDGVMRVIDSGGSCGGDQQVRLKPRVEKPCEPEEPQDVEALRRRVAELEASVSEPTRDVVGVAPFEVVNEAGVPVFKVSPWTPGDPQASTEFFNEVGKRYAVIVQNQDGGSLGVQSGAERPSGWTRDNGEQGTVEASWASLKSFGEYSDLSVEAKSAPRIRMGRRDTGRYGFSVVAENDSAKVIAGFGESQAGSGIAMVYDLAGLPRASLWLSDGTGSGSANILDATGKNVASLIAAGFGDSGLLTLRNNAGETMVEAGTLNTGIGVVRAGPGAFQHGLHWIGLPASYIEGKK